MSPPPSLVEVGRITRPHGLRGEVVVALTSDREERVAVGATLETERGPLVVAAARREHRKGQQRHTSQYSQHWVVAFRGHDGRDAAEALRGLALRAEPIVDPDAMWVDDPDAVRIHLGEGRSLPRLTVRVGPSDMGRVIGKRGRVAQAIRTVVRAAAVRDGTDVEVEFED